MRALPWFLGILSSLVVLALAPGAAAQTVPTPTPTSILGGLVDVLATSTPTPSATATATASPTATRTATTTRTATPSATPLPVYAKIDPALRELMTDRTRQLPVIVEMGTAPRPFAPRPNEKQAQRALDLLRLYGQPVGGLSLINAAAGYADAAGIEHLSRIADVAFIHEDSVVRPRRGSETRLTFPPGQLSATYPRAVGADKAWLEGTTGRGVTVAVLDSGITPDPDLVQPNNRILARVSFAGDHDPVRPDPGGHGTHLAGTIAGNGTRSAGEYVGIAPEASLVDVRVLNRNGNGRISSVVRGIEWVLAHKAQYNIRVVNLSFGAPARRSYRTDPLTAAAEIAWRRGVVVVAAAGNGGPSSGTVESPGIDPFVITVGGIDDKATLPLGDDDLAFFSAWGIPPESTARPDLAAPGRRIVSVRAPGSYLDTLFPDRVVTARNGATYFRLSGTSMSTAVVSGAVALLLQRQPSLTPDQVKAILVATATSYGQSGGTPPPDPTADGAGYLDAYAAATSPLRGAANGGLRPADGFARALYPVLYGTPLSYRDGTPVDWSNVYWDRTTWDNVYWDNVYWDNVYWDNVYWDNVYWDNVYWDRAGWDSLNWDSLTLD